MYYQGRAQSISTLPVNTDPDNTSQYKIITLGNAGVGKSTLIASYAKGTYDKNITHRDLSTRKLVQTDVHTVDKNGNRMTTKKLLQIELWDTEGQERYDSIAPNYYRGAQGCLLCFDITNEDSFSDLKSWYDRLKQKCGQNIPAAIVVGTKSDQRQSQQFIHNIKSSADCRLAARNLGLEYREVSCHRQETIDETFKRLIEMMEQKRNDSNNGLNNPGGFSCSITLEPKDQSAKKSFCQNLC